MAHRRATVGQVLGAAVRDAVIAAYRATNWKPTHAAERLGVSRRTLLRWVARYDLRQLLERNRK